MQHKAREPELGVWDLLWDCLSQSRFVSEHQIIRYQSVMEQSKHSRGAPAGT